MPPVAGFLRWLRSLLQGGRNSDVARWHRALDEAAAEPRQTVFRPIAIWHPDSTTLIMFSYASVEKRAGYVRANRPQHEISTRLRLMKAVRGPLPTAVEEALDEVERAERALEEATHEYIKRTASARDAKERLAKPASAARAAGDAAVEENWSAIEALHQVECPDCPWDGRTIFPNMTMEEAEASARADRSPVRHP
jgi:hypothetical protein